MAVDTSNSHTTLTVVAEKEVKPQGSVITAEIAHSNAPLPLGGVKVGLKEVLDGVKVPPQVDVHSTVKSDGMAGGGIVIERSMGSPGAILAPAVSSSTDGITRLPMTALKAKL